MDNSLKALLLAAGVAITCLVVSLGFFISRQADGPVSTSAKQIAGMGSTMNNFDLQMYNNKDVTGSAVLDAAVRLYGKYIVRVVTKANTNGFTDVQRDLRTDDLNYVNESAMFLAELIKDKNGSVVEIRFTQQGAVYSGE